MKRRQSTGNLIYEPQTLGSARMVPTLVIPKKGRNHQNHNSENFISWGTESGRQHDGKTEYQRQCGVSHTLEDEVPSRSCEPPIIRSRSGNLRNFSHGITPNDSLSKIYDQHLGVRSPLRSPLVKQSRSERKRQINPAQMHSKVKR